MSSFEAVARERPPHISYYFCFLFILLFCKQATDTQRNWLFWCNFQRLQEPSNKVVLTVSPTSVCFIIHYVHMNFFISPSHPTPVQKILHINRLYIKCYKISSRSIKHPYPQKHKKFKRKNIFQKY